MGFFPTIPVWKRKALMLFLLAAFATQCLLVYRDDSGRLTPPLSERAAEGRRVWLKHNCQACHQLYGFGGFLGPDLTNAIRRLDDDSLYAVLTAGKGPMPAFHFTAGQIEAVKAFLVEIDRTGIGQARALRVAGKPFGEVLAEFHATGRLNEEAARGSEVYMARCAGCHTPLAENLIGAWKAPDLSLSAATPAPEAIMATLNDGRPERGMPAPALSSEQRRDVAAFLDWLARTRRELEPYAPRSGGGKLFWFEYR